MRKKLSNNFIFILVGIFLIAAVLTLFSSGQKKPEEISFTQFLKEAKEERVDSIDVVGNKMDLTLKDGSKQITYKEEGSNLKDFGIDYSKITVNPKPVDNSGNLILSILINILPFFILFLVMYFLMRQAQGSSNQAMSFGKSRARLFGNDKKRVTFKDVAGVVEAKEDLTEVVEFLKSPTKFTSLGAKIPKGVLLYGSPGTGKTLLARAVAGEAAVPFFSISGSEFVEMFVGVGASRVRDLFSKAKKNAPCIVFIDEIDAVGRQRGTGLGGGHDEREQTLNQILVEMDGFDTHDYVIVMAATNRPDVLDPALLRPGRFDRRVILDLPDVKHRKEILDVHSRNKPMDKGVALEEIARKTPGFSGADLANLVNEAALLAARRNQKKITTSELHESVERVLLGPERKSHILSKKEKEITAYHEAGHALVGHMLPHTDPVHKVSIVSRGGAGGVTWSLPIEDKKLHSRVDFEDQMAMMMGGRIAELLVYGEENVTTGAENDIQNATKLARRMVTEFAMSESLGNQVFGHKEEMVFLGRELGEQRNYSEAIASKIDSEVARLLDEASKKASDLITKNRKMLEKIAKRLIEVETLEAKEFEELFKKAADTKSAKPAKNPNMPLRGKPATG